MANLDKEVVKKHMLENRKFQKWMQDTRTHEMKENPDWQEAVTEVLGNVMDELGTSTQPDTRQEVEAIMTEYVDENKKKGMPRKGRPSNELDPETEQRTEPDKGDDNA